MGFRFFVGEKVGDQAQRQLPVAVLGEAAQNVQLSGAPLGGQLGGLAAADPSQALGPALQRFAPPAGVLKNLGGRVVLGDRAFGGKAPKGAAGVETPDRRVSGAQVSQAAQSRVKLVAGDELGVFEGDFARRAQRAAQTHAQLFGFPHDFVQRQPQGIEGFRPEQFGVGLEVIARGFFLLLKVRQVSRRLGGKEPAFREILQKLLSVDAAAVQLQNERIQAGLPQLAFHDFQSRHLFGDEEHLFALGQAGGDQIGDGLGLAGSGRAFDHEVFAF